MVFFTRLGVAPELSESAETSPPPDRARSTGAALEAHYRFVVWLVPTLERFPRSQKFLLGDRIQHTALDVLERLIEATYTRHRGGQLALANIGIEKLRFLCRAGARSTLLGCAPLSLLGVHSLVAVRALSVLKALDCGVSCRT